MTYLTASIAAVPTANRQKYIEHAEAFWPMVRSGGATRMSETWGTDVPRGKVTDFHMAVNATEDESIVFSWIVWPDKATADTCWQAMSERGAEMPAMPFDGSRMIFGGFTTVYERGADAGATHYQGFALAVPGANKASYIEMADWGWDMFRKQGALGMVEAWGEDVPRGKQTDFYRATKAEEGEVPVFSWISWPDRATCEAASRAMEAEMEGKEMPAMPFDGMRMMWAGFEPIFDSDTM